MWYNKSDVVTQERVVILPDPRISIDGNYSLKINNVQESDASQYYCKVLPENLKLSMKVNLEIISSPTATILDKDGRNLSGRQVTYHQGDRIEVECKGFGNPTPQIKWFTKGERIASGSDNVHVNNGYLIIDHADHDHVKLYQCLADNGIAVGHATFTINVQCRFFSFFSFLQIYYRKVSNFRFTES